jgi:hypothetical protein
MGKAYSDDLRERVEARIAAGHSRRDAARHFGVSASFAVKLAQRVAASGSVAPSRQGRPPGHGKLAEHLPRLIAWVESWSPVSGQFLFGVKLGPDQFTPPNTVCPVLACMPRRVFVPRARNAGVGYCSNRSSVRCRPWPRCRSRRRGDRRIRISGTARAVR